MACRRPKKGSVCEWEMGQFPRHKSVRSSERPTDEVALREGGSERSVDAPGRSKHST